MADAAASKALPERVQGEIRPATAGERLEAAARLVGAADAADRGAASRFLRYAERNAIDLEDFWIRRAPGGGVDAAVLAVPNRGRTAMLFVSPARSGGDVSATAELLDAVALSLASRGVVLAQALLEPDEDLPRRTLEAGGFRHLAMLSYLERELGFGTRVATASWPEDVTIETWDESRAEDFLTALNRSYVGTLDCPGLCGLRRTEDVLAGHRHTGRFEPDLWTLLRRDDEPAGVLLLNADATGRAGELIYLGLAPEVRGRGLGARLLRHGLAASARRRWRRISLAVDEANEPALRIYRREGFRRVARRSAYIRALVDGEVARPDGAGR